MSLIKRVEELERVALSPELIRNAIKLYRTEGKIPTAPPMLFEWMKNFVGIVDEMKNAVPRGKSENERRQ